MNLLRHWYDGRWWVQEADATQEIERLQEALWAITQTTTDDVQRIKDVARGALVEGGEEVYG